MTIKDIHENTICRHVITNEIIQFKNVHHKKDICKIIYLKSEVKKQSFNCKISGCYFMFRFNLWVEIDVKELEKYE